VRLFVRDGCHLCEEAQAELERLRTRHPHELELVDIGASPESAELVERYGERIPVLEVGGIEYDAPLSRRVIEQALRASNGDR